MPHKKTDCPFCLVADNHIPASTIYECDDFLIIMDLYPLTKGHVLVVPKTHVQHIYELPSPLQDRLFKLGRQVMKAQRLAGYGVKGINLLLNDGKLANQTVPHAHLHLIPRSRYDFLRSLPKLTLHVTGIFGRKTKRATLDEQARQIKQYFTLP